MLKVGEVSHSPGIFVALRAGPKGFDGRGDTDLLLLSHWAKGEQVSQQRSQQRAGLS